MSYPRNSATPPTIAVGEVHLIADGSVVTADALARVLTAGGAWGAKAGTLTCDATSGCWYYAPTQGETNGEWFIVAVYKASCTGCQITVVTGASAVTGRTMPADGSITAAVIADAAIDNATFAADVGSTAYASNIVALAVRKVLDELNLDHLMKVAVANNADLTAEVADATVLSHVMSAGDTSVFAPATDGLQPSRDENATAAATIAKVETLIGTV